MKQLWAILGMFALCSTYLGNPFGEAPTNTVLVHAGHLIDVRAGKVLENQGILIEGDRIKQVGDFETVRRSAPATARLIDLSKETVLPGLADCHTHVLLQGDVTATDYDEQLLKESIPYRTIRGTVAARTALMNGFTVIRDVEPKAPCTPMSISRPRSTAT